MCLSVATIRMATRTHEKIVQTNNQLVDTTELWLTKDEHNRVFWSPILHLNLMPCHSMSVHCLRCHTRPWRL